MPEYRRVYMPGGTYFFTIVTFDRQPLFADPANIDLLRHAIHAVHNERPFDFIAGVILPDHTHFIWTLPDGESNYSWRIGRMKVLFTRSPRESCSSHTTTAPSESRDKHGEATVWQRRFNESEISSTGRFEADSQQVWANWRNERLRIEEHMPKNLTKDTVSDEQIAASVEQAEVLLRSLNLTDAEHIWAKRQATAIFKAVTDEFLDSGKAFKPLRAICAPAAVAYALSIASDWSAKSELLASTDKGD
jgi:REP element-mobilizing transposase RayT